MNKNRLLQFLALCLVCAIGSVHADVFVDNDVFGLEYADDPQIAPDGERVIYVRKSMDIMKDRSRSNLWIIDSNGSNHRAIASSSANFFSPRWSPEGNRLAFTLIRGRQCADLSCAGWTVANRPTDRFDLISVLSELVSRWPP